MIVVLFKYLPSVVLNRTTCFMIKKSPKPQGKLSCRVNKQKLREKVETAFNQPNYKQDIFYFKTKFFIWI